MLLLLAYDGNVRASGTCAGSKEQAEENNVENFNFVVWHHDVWANLWIHLHCASLKLQATVTDLPASVRVLSAAPAWFLIVRFINSTQRIKLELIAKRKRVYKNFHDDLTSDCRLVDLVMTSRISFMFYTKLVDSVINWVLFTCRFEEQRQNSELLMDFFVPTKCWNF